MNIDIIMQELAEYVRLQEEINAHIDGLKDTLKAYMNEHNTDTLIGREHKATYKSVTSSRVDTKALKADQPELVKLYTKTSTSKRFLFT